MAARYSKDALVVLVRAHADRNYDSGGWDVVVEAWDDDQLREAIGRATTEAGAIRNVGRWVGTYDEHRRDIEATAF